MIRLLAAALLGFAPAGLPAERAPAADAPRVEVTGTSLRVWLADGRLLTGEALVGAVLTVSDRQGRRRRIRIDGAVPDGRDARGPRWLYRLMVADPDSGDWSAFCRPGPDGRSLGFPLEGSTTADGDYRPTAGRLTFACTSGALGKCIRLGYAPWDRGPDGRPLLDHFRACLRMIRADYCGDGRAHTREGTPINVYDRLGIQESEPNAAMRFEAAWGPEGAVCVGRTRIDGAGPVSDLAAACPARLAGRVGRACSRALALGLPQALILNDSRGTTLATRHRCHRSRRS